MMNGTVGRVPRASAISDLKRRDASSGNETKSHRSREEPSGLEIHQVTLSRVGRIIICLRSSVRGTY